MAVTDNFIIFISQPIFAADGQYLGAVGGSIYLKQESMLDTLLGSHFYQDGSYVFVVDKNKHIIYHPNNKRVGERISNNDAINQVSQGESGKTPLINSQGIEMLAGYAVVPSTGWGIVAQRPKTVTLAPLNALMRSVLYKTLPIALLMLLVIWWSARRITSPLRQLANGARAMDRPETAQQIQSVKSWYFESQELKKAMLRGIGLLQRNITKLREDVNTDPLTGLGNRRHLEAAITAFQAEKMPFAVVAIDIDHFKKINDGFGHDAGDEVIRQLGRQIRKCPAPTTCPAAWAVRNFCCCCPPPRCTARPRLQSACARWSSIPSCPRWAGFRSLWAWRTGPTATTTSRPCSSRPTPCSTPPSARAATGWKSFHRPRRPGDYSRIDS